MTRDTLSRDDLSHFQTVKSRLDYFQLMSLSARKASHKVSILTGRKQCQI